MKLDSFKFHIFNLFSTFSRRSKVDQRRVQVLHSAEVEGRRHQVEGLPQQPLDGSGHDGLPLSNLLPDAASRTSCSGLFHFVALTL